MTGKGDEMGQGEVISGTTTCAFSGLQPFFEEKKVFRSANGSSLADSVVVKYSCIFLKYSKPTGVFVIWYNPFAPYS